MRISKRSIFVFSAAFGICAMALTGTASAAQPHGSYLATVNGLPIQLLINLDRHGGMTLSSTTDFGVSRRASPSYGAWKRDTSHAINFVVYSFIFNGAGDHIETERISGRATTTDLYATASIEATIDIFLPSQDPFDPNEVPAGGGVVVTAEAKQVPGF